MRVPRRLGFRPDAMAEVDAVIDDAVAARAFPGAVAAVGKDGALVHLKRYGRLSYDADAPPVDERTIYDLASLTKVIVTTTMAMILVDEGKLDIDKPVSAFLPAFKGGLKDKVTVRHLLTHSGGQAGGVTYLYKELKGKEAYVDYIQAWTSCTSRGRRRSTPISGRSCSARSWSGWRGRTSSPSRRERIFEPLGMKDTTLPARRPSCCRASRRPRTIPGAAGILRGEVHDENAFALGGVAAHAGLFGTASDLARFAQMMLNGGVLRAQAHRVPRDPGEVHRAGPPGAGLVARAGLGHARAAPRPRATLFSPRSFGHTGYTGTSMWIDPESKAFAILLTNRVHPTRENTAIFAVRRAFADAVVRGLGIQ